MQRDAAVRATDLSLRYHSSSQVTRSIAVDGVDFEIGSGEILAVVGETGSGKSTLARAVALQADIAGDRRSPRISGGGLEVLGEEVRGITRRRRDRLQVRVGFLRQEAGQHLSPRLTVEENIIEPIYLVDRRFDREAAGAHAATLLDAVHLPLSMLDEMPHELSKGQRQRVAIARSLVLEPALLVADDPTAGIDVTVRSHILDVIAQLQERRSFAALVVTADLAEVRRITDRVAVMQQGRIVGIGPMDDVFDDPQHPYVRRLGESLGAMRASA
ncbi:MAG: ABC transporter ATP-binding protein [Microbacteriaceae bacterium]|nr:ABC transporter ATP-binding protein [Microbacteriaceae bacterium]